jgi:glycosyltransferase involved in cell wall biosynthesis
MDRLRVCLVSREIAPYFGAGIGAYAAQMLRAWSAAGHEAHLVTADHDSLRGVEGPVPGARVHIAGWGEGPRARFWFQRHAWAVRRKLLELHAEAPFDYIEFPDYWAEGAFAIAAKRTLGEFGGAVLGVRLHSTTRICRELNGEAWLDEEMATLQCEEERAIADADAVISPSASLLERIAPQSCAWQVRAVVPYPFECARERQSAAAPGRAASRTILYFGRLERRKGVDVLIGAAGSLMDEGLDIRVRLIGGDTRTGPRNSSMREHLAGLIPARHASRFSLEEPLTREALAGVIRETARGRAGGGVCCFPSRWENFPNVCLEAMSEGALVVGSDAGGMAEIIEHHRSGLLFRGGDAGDLAAKLREAIGDDDARRKMGEGARRRIRELCEPARVVAQMTEMIGRSRRAAGRAIDAVGADIALVLHDPLALPREDLLSRVRSCRSEWALIVERGASVQLEDGDAPILRALGRAAAAGAREAAIAVCAVDGETLHVPSLHAELLAAVQPTPLGAVLVRTAAARELPSMADFPPEAHLWALLAALCSRGLTIRTIPVPLARAAPMPIPEHMREATLAQAALVMRGGAFDQTVSARLLLAQSVHQRERHAQERARLTAEIAEARALAGTQRAHIDALEEQLRSARYRLADRLSEAAKSAGLGGVLRSVASRVKPEERP